MAAELANQGLLKRLIKHRFVTKHRRSKMIGTPQGDRRVQDSNAYEVHMPNAGLAVVPLVADKVAASGSDNPDVSMLENKAAIHKLHKLGHWLSHL